MNLQRADLLLLFERATNLPSGVSPCVPLFLLAMAIFSWGFLQMRRVQLYEKHRVRCPFPGQPWFEAVQASARRAERLIVQPRLALKLSKASIIGLCVCAVVFVRISSRFAPTVEGRWFDVAILVGTTLVVLLVLYALLHAWALWRAVRDLLRELAHLPLAPAYSGITQLVSSMFGPYLSSERPDRESHRQPLSWQRGMVHREYGESRLWLRMALRLTPEEMSELGVDEPLGVSCEVASSESSELPKANQAQLHETAEACLQLLPRLWHSLDLHEAFGEDPRVAPREVAKSVIDSSAPVFAQAGGTGVSGSDGLYLRSFRKEAEQYVALHLMSYLSQFFVQLRNSLRFLTVAPLLLLLAVIGYPLQPQRLWLLAAGGTILTVAVVGVRMFLQIERDEVISKATGGTPNQIDFRWTFVGNVLAYTVPLVGGLLAVSLDLSDLMHSWLDPLLQAAR